MSPMGGILPHDGCRSRPPPIGWTTSNHRRARSRRRPRAPGGARWVAPSQEEDPRREVAGCLTRDFARRPCPHAHLARTSPTRQFAAPRTRPKDLPAMASVPFRLRQRRWLFDQPDDRPPQNTIACGRSRPAAFAGTIDRPLIVMAKPCRPDPASPADRHDAQHRSQAQRETYSHSRHGSNSATRVFA